MKHAISAAVIVLLSSWPSRDRAAGMPVIDLPDASSPLTPGQQLQQAVNDPAHAGVQLRLARGTYLLDPSGPNGGRLVLPPGMEIVGENRYLDCDGDGVWDPVGACSGEAFDPARFTLDDSETLIDGTAITSAQPPPVGGAAVVRMGRDNGLARVTIRAARRPGVAGSVDVNVSTEDGVIRAEVRDSILEGGQRGVRCNNGAPARSGITAFALFEGNVFRDQSPVAGGVFGFGLQVQNSAATASTWTVEVRHSRITGTPIGMFVVGNGSTRAETRVHSLENLVQGNEMGAFLVAAFAPAGGAVGDAANENHLSFVSQGDTFADNVTTPARMPALLGLGGGVMAFAAARDAPLSGACSRNALELQLLQTTFRGNAGGGVTRHLSVAGSFASATAGSETGVENHVRLLLRRVEHDGAPGAFLVADEVPFGGSDSNDVSVLGSDVALERTNADLEAPTWLPP